MINRAQVMGDEAGEEIAMGSVVYLGRGSFRMETVVETLDDDGAPREVTGIVTSPYRPRTEVPANDSTWILDEDATKIIARARAGQWRPDDSSATDPLFGSQPDMPVLLSAPTELIFGRRPRRVSISRGALIAAGMLFFACGLASGTVAWRTTSARVATVTLQPHGKQAPRATVPALPSEPARSTTTAVVTPTMFDLPEPILVRVHKKTAAVSSSAAAATSSAGGRAGARWVDPFAD